MGKKIYLRNANPDFFKELKESDNPGVVLEDLSASDATLVTWCCAVGHKWQTRVRNRARENTPCPYCSKKRASSDYNLGTELPHLVSQWNQQRNHPLKIENCLPSSTKKVWWICDKGHEWEVSPNTRSAGNGCPYCSNRRVGYGNDLASTAPQIAAAWHPTKNGNFTPSDVTPNSSKRVFWLCEKGHEWKTSVTERTKGSGCPYCVKSIRGRKSASKPSATYNLETECPGLMSEWSSNNIMKPSDLLPNSNKKVLWVCERGHEYSSPPSSRMQGRGCPYCAGKKVSSSYNFETEYPAIAAQWNYEKNDRLPIEFTPKSGRVVWWTCEVGHEWKATINNRTSQGSGCPYCAPTNSKASPEDNLAVTHPALLSEWDWEKNRPLVPEEFKSGSTKKVYWRCQFGHSWKAVIGSRADGGRNCPKCRKSISRAELRVYSELREYFPDVVHNTKIEGIECDLLLGGAVRVAIELDGRHWHKGNEDHDANKNKRLKNLGISVVRLRDYSLGKIENWDISYDEKSLSPAVVAELIRVVCAIQCIEEPINLKSYESLDTFPHEVAYQDLLARLPLPPIGMSLAEQRPDIAEYWDYERNGSLTPHQFKPTTRQKVFWRCEKGHTFEREIAVMVKSRGCPNCNKSHHVVAPTREDSFGGRYPELLKTWSSRNSADPFQLPPASNKEYWFECERGHAWQTSLDKRGKYGCPYCSGHRVSNYNSLAAVSPYVASEWHPERNGDITPETITVGTRKIKPWWLCSHCEFEWQAMANDRVKKRTGCPKCKNRPPDPAASNGIS